ncbi:MAG: hypothetical protein Q8K85_20895, partial [Hyphomicrobium sp.]|nr:hypothetical protein [Hyphomicrobium sp.]
MKTRIVGCVVVIGCVAMATWSATAYAKGCGYGSGYYITVNNNTSCGFARNVARKVSQGYRHPTVYSPATGRYYKMDCYRRSGRSYACT